MDLKRSLQSNLRNGFFWTFFEVFFHFRARHVRKVLGGAWRQAGIVASAGLVALNEMIDRLAIDHEHTYRIAKGLFRNLSECAGGNKIDRMFKGFRSVFYYVFVMLNCLQQFTR